MAKQGVGCTECKFGSCDNSWRPESDFNYSPQFLFVVDQFHPSLARRTKRLLDSCDFDTSNIEVAFLTRCWAGDDKTAQVKEGQRCRALLDPILDKLPKNTIVVPMGATPCKVVAGQKSIQTAHGTVSELSNGLICVPTFHPKQVVAYPDSLPNFVADLKKIQDAADGKIEKAADTHYIYVDTIKKFKQMITELWMSEAYSVDIESSSLDPHRSKPFKAEILNFAFSNRATTAWFLPWDHPQARWSKKERAYIEKWVKVLLEATDRGLQIAHGSDFDYRYIRKVADILLGRYDFDTLLAHYVAVTEEKGTHYLKNLAWEFTDMGGYDDGLEAYKLEHPECDPSKGGSYRNIPLDVLFPYACGDADCTFRLYEQFNPMIGKEFYDLFYNLMMPAQRTLADIEYEGAPIDMEWLAHCQEVYPRLLNGTLGRMREFPEVLEVERILTENARKKKQKERIKRFKERAKTIEKLRGVDDIKADRAWTRLKADIERAKVNPVTVAPTEFNPASPAQKSMLLFQVMGFKPTKRAKGWTKDKPSWSTDKEVLKELWFDTKHEIVMCLGKWTKMHTLYSMFVEKLPDILGDDGRLRGGYNLAGTETGRLSCSNPNLQQIPRKLKEDPREPFVDVTWPSIKKLFYAIPDHCIMQFDYSQAELRVLAAFTQEPTLVNAYKAGEDVHARVAAEVFGVALEDVTTPQRDQAKKVNFGLLYGQGAKRLAKALGITEDEAKAFIKKYFKTLQRVRKWINKIKAFVRENGWVKSPYGRLRRLATAFSPEQDIVARAERQGVNSPIQNTASDCTLLSLFRINTVLKAKGLKSRIIVTVHDSIILLVPLAEAKLVYRIVKKIMENPPDWTGWMKNVHMVADAEIGRNWGSLQAVKKVEDIDSVVESWGKAA